MAPFGSDPPPFKVATCDGLSVILPGLLQTFGMLLPFRIAVVPSSYVTWILSVPTFTALVGWGEPAAGAAAFGSGAGAAGWAAWPVRPAAPGSAGADAPRSGGSASCGGS